MEESARWGVVLAITLYVLVVAWASRRTALDMDDHGFEGWVYGLATFVVPPLGLLAWALDRREPPGPRGIGPAGIALGFVAVVITFPWGLIVWLLLRRRPANP